MKRSIGGFSFRIGREGRREGARSGELKRTDGAVREQLRKLGVPHAPAVGLLIRLTQTILVIEKGLVASLEASKITEKGERDSPRTG